MERNAHKKLPKKIVVKDVNACITCALCRGYLVDATTLVDCLHSFCRTCILRYFENYKSLCPTCNILQKKKGNPAIRPDPVLQTLVYKLVPGLYSREVQRREDFYRSTGVRASSSCSEDSVLGDLKEEREEWMLSSWSEQNQYISPDDAISLSLEYYQAHLDTTDATNKKHTGTNSTNEQDSSTTAINHNNDKISDPINKNSANSSAETYKNTCDKNINKDKVTDGESVGGDGSGEKKDVVKLEPDEGVTDKAADDKKFKVKSEKDDDCSVELKKTENGERRYLQCPAAVTMSHLQKFLRMKFALCSEHRVDIIHSGEVLPSYFSLIDVAYTFKWQRTKPMRFFYRIFTPLKIQPIKIISTPSVGGKQLQVVPAKSNNSSSQPSSTEISIETLLKTSESEAQHYRNKERLMANLQLQSTSKLLEKTSSKRSSKKDTTTEEEDEETDCVYEYEEPDKEEIRAFAEKRDREWALQKQLDEEKEKYRNSKKRKKNKHSKGNLLYKKRKLHAEITCSESLQKEESLKLKVKLTPHNGYKHKHHKSSQQNSAETSQSKQSELSSKEKLLQMRQVRHKQIAIDDKSKASSSAATPKSVEETPTVKTAPNPVAVKNNEEPKASASKPENGTVAKTLNNNNNSKTDVGVKSSEAKKLPENALVPVKVTEIPIKPENVKSSPSGVQKESAITSSGKTLRSDFAIKTNATKGLCMQKSLTVQLERNEQTEKQAQKAFLKTFQSYTEKFNNQTQQEKNTSTSNPKVRLNTYPGRNPSNGPTNHHQQAARSLEQKIANLHQQCTTIEPKPIVTKIENKPPQILNSNYSTSGFTVSKVEAGVKRKPENEHGKRDKRPSLEITLINPSPVESQQQETENKPATKRPLPATIPLEKIKKSMNRMSGISIISKAATERCDNSGALDLSKPNRSLDVLVKPQPAENTNKILNGLSLLPGKLSDRADKLAQLSNLQMLSKVALEHPNLNKTLPQASTASNNKRTQMPSLQTLKIPIPHHSGLKSNLAKLPKLNEINKNQFRISNAQLRNMRPNQNQSVRDIPNPSLLVRQQNQNRLNSLSCNQNNSGESKESSTKQNGPTTETASPKNETKEKNPSNKVDEKPQNQVSVAKEKS